MIITGGIAIIAGNTLPSKPQGAPLPLLSSILYIDFAHHISTHSKTLLLLILFYRMMSVQPICTYKSFF